MENKKIADRLLIILLLLFIINIFIKIYFHKNFYLEMISFVIEAALIGGIADWFAVTALFRKPLGFPWHTAIIPRNRDKVVNAVAHMVEHELLSEKILKGKIKDINIIDTVIEFIDKNIKEGKEIYKLIEKVGIRILNSINIEKLAVAIEGGVKNSIREVDLSLYLSKTLDFAIKSGEFNKVFVNTIDTLIAKAKEESSKVAIENIINKEIEDYLNSATGFKRMMMEIALGVAKQTNSVNITEVSVSIQEQIIEMLERLKNEEDPLHIELFGKFQEFIDDLRSNENVIENIEKWKIETIDKVTVFNELNEIIENVFRALKYGIKAENLENNNLLLQGEGDEKSKVYINNVVPAIEWIKEQLNMYWEDFKKNDKAKNAVENYIKELIYKIIQAEHSFVGIVVKKVLNNLTDDSLNKFIEQKAGNDLHWIRINGCLVGGIFGLVVFLFINELYLPVITRLFNI